MGNWLKKKILHSEDLCIVDDIKKGENFTNINVRRIRPGYGISPKFYDEIIGKKALKDIEKGTPVSWEMVSKK